MKSEEFRRILKLAEQAHAKDYPASAFELYKRILSHAPKRDSARWRAALNLIEVGRLTNAETFLNSLRRNAASKPWLIEYAMGRLCTAQSRLLEAEAHFRRARKMNPTETPPAVFLADCLIRQEKFDEAESVLLKAVNAKGDTDEVYQHLGRAARAKGEYGTALDFFVKSLEIVPDNVGAKLGVEDMDFLSRALDSDTQQIPHLAEAAHAQEYSASAFELYKRVTLRAPKDETARLRASQNLIELERLSEAEAYLDAIPRNASPKPWLIEHVMGHLRRGQSRYAAAEIHYRAAQKMKLRSTVPAVFLADCLIRQEKFDEAQSVLLTAVNAKGDTDEVYKQLGRTARAKGNYQDARDYFAKSLQIAFNCEGSREGFEDMEFLLKNLGLSARLTSPSRNVDPAPVIFEILLILWIVSENGDLDGIFDRPQTSDPTSIISFCRIMQRIKISVYSP